MSNYTKRMGENCIFDRKKSIVILISVVSSNRAQPNFAQLGGTATSARTIRSQRSTAAWPQHARLSLLAAARVRACVLAVALATSVRALVRGRTHREPRQARRARCARHVRPPLKLNKYCR